MSATTTRRVVPRAGPTGMLRSGAFSLAREPASCACMNDANVAQQACTAAPQLTVMGHESFLKDLIALTRSRNKRQAECRGEGYRKRTRVGPHSHEK